MNRMRVYLAGPITGCSYDGATNWRQWVTDKLAIDFKCYSPMRAKEFLQAARDIGPHGYDLPHATAHAIFKRDTFDVRHCDVLLVNLENASQISIGTVMEMMLAHELDKFVAVAMDEGNVHDHVFVQETASVIFPTLEKTVAYVHHIFGALA